jgi:hypothetical protein
MLQVRLNAFVLVSHKRTEESIMCWTNCHTADDTPNGTRHSAQYQAAPRGGSLRRTANRIGTTVPTTLARQYMSGTPGTSERHLSKTQASVLPGSLLQFTVTTSRVLPRAGHTLRRSTSRSTGSRARPPSPEALPPPDMATRQARTREPDGKQSEDRGHTRGQEKPHEGRTTPRFDQNEYKPNMQHTNSHNCYLCTCSVEDASRV